MELESILLPGVEAKRPIVNKYIYFLPISMGKMPRHINTFHYQHITP